MSCGAGLEIIAAHAVPDVEPVADHRVPHRVGAIKERPVFHGLKGDVSEDVGRPPPVPAGALPVFGLGKRGFVHLACWGT